METIIVGGGVAGLTCLNALQDAGVEAVLYEGSMIGTPKMCGEFIAPDAYELLQKWGMNTLFPISSAEFYVGRNSLSTQLIHKAGAVSRSEAELFLAERARSKGGKIYENSQIRQIQPPINESLPYRLTLSNGNEARSRYVFFATGRLNASTLMHLPYVGIKMHLPKPASLSTLQMFSIKNAYMGLVPISDSTCNFACIALDTPTFSFENIIEEAMDQYPLFTETMKEIDLKNHYHLLVKAPAFGFRKLPAWKNAFWIGDALASIHPAIGSGFSHAMTSAHCAVEDYLHHSSFHQKNYKIQLRKKMLLGFYLHHIMLRPGLGKVAVNVAKKTMFNNAVQSILFNSI